MRLSDAMRLGAMALPPIYGPIFHRKYGEGGFGICGACAVGTVLYAAAGIAGVRQMDEASDGAAAFMAAFIETHWPWARAWRQQHQGRSMSNKLIELYEEERWSRERIADWIEAQEVETERQRALTNSTSDVRGTTEIESPVLSTRAS